MRITDMKQTRKGRYSIYIDEEYVGVLHPDVFYRFSYKIGDLIEEEDLEEFFDQSQMVIAKERAIGLLSARFYTRKGLKEKLLRDVDMETADAVSDRMEELGLLDDRDYALRYAKDCINMKGFSHHHTSMALMQKGIPKDIIAETLEALGEEDSEELIYKQIKRRYLHRLEDEKDQKRAISALQRKGFRYGDIRRVIDNLAEDQNYYEYEEPWNE